MGKGSHTADTEPLQVVPIREDPIFSGFLRPDFHAAQFASEVLASSNPTAQVIMKQRCSMTSCCWHVLFAYTTKITTYVSTA